MPQQRVFFRMHAIRRMCERDISVEDVANVLAMGEIIERYPDDTPYPSRLVLGFVGNRPLHVVAADNTADQETIVVTVYEPSPDMWDAAFRRRQRP